MVRLLLRRLAALLLPIALVACSTNAPAPIEDRAAPRPVAPPPAAMTVPPPAAPVPPPPPEPRVETYTIKRGDTLFQIALDHGLDYRELAAWNGIENVNHIRAGQTLRLGAPGGEAAASATGSTATSPGGATTAPLKAIPPVVAAGNSGAAASSAPGTGPAAAGPAPAPEPRPAGAASRNTDTYKSQPKAIKEAYSERALREMQRAVAAAPPPAAAPATPPAASAPAAVAEAKPRAEAATPAKPESKEAAAGDEDEDRMQWSWPATGKIVTAFSDTANMKGIDIAGRTGQPVLASAPGKVVYAGTGLRGYGKLIIIKHSRSFLSAYAHNRDILVKEGQQVTRGQKIAEMGNTDADQVKLHFEIRRLGKPIDPMKFLPPA